MSIPRTTLYTHVQPDGTNIHINVDSLLAAIKAAQLEVVLVPVEMRVVRAFIDGNAISARRMMQLTPEQLFQPIIYGYDGTRDKAGRGNVLMIDGHHRYARAASDGLPLIRSYVVERYFWEAHRLELPAMTQEELRNLPPHAVSYYAGQKRTQP